MHLTKSIIFPTIHHHQFIHWLFFPSHFVSADIMSSGMSFYYHYPWHVVLLFTPTWWCGRKMKVACLLVSCRHVDQITHKWKKWDKELATIVARGTNRTRVGVFVFRYSGFEWQKRVLSIIFSRCDTPFLPFFPKIFINKEGDKG